MKIAIVGSGIAGMTAAHLLHGAHEITLFEAGSHVGGHTHTAHLVIDGRPLALDTGFIVFNNRTYPNFARLLDHLGVASQESDMSFSVRCDRTGFEYCGSSLNALFADRRNFARPSFYRMLRDILRFNREAPAILEDADDERTLGELVAQGRYGAEFVERYLMPMGAAIWSASSGQMHAFPARFFVRFFRNHGLLSVADRPRWRVVRGGSDRYVALLTAPFAERVRLVCPVAGVERRPDHVVLTTVGGERSKFDHVVIAAHADQALAMLADPTPTEQAVLGAFTYQRNEAVLHGDESQLPRRRRAWASWNYHLGSDDRGVAVTYLLNRLQGIDSPRQFCVTLNRTDRLAPEKIHRRVIYHHPLYTARAVAAQLRRREVSGARRTHYCGAYWGNGFHEDGVVSAIDVARNFGLDFPACKAASTKAMCGTVASSP